MLHRESACRDSQSISGLLRQPVASTATHTARLMPISTIEVSAGLLPRSPPYGVRPLRVCLAPSLTQSGHWKPTDAGRMQSGQIGFSQRWQRTYVSRPVCRKHTGTVGSAGVLSCGRSRRS